MNKVKLEDNLLKEYLTLCKRAFAYNFIFSFFINVLMLATSIYSLQVLDRVLSSYSIETLVMLSIIMVIIYIILTFLQIIRSFVFTQIANWLDSKLATPLLESSISFEAKSKGSQNIRDLQTIKSFITGQAVTVLFDSPWSIIYFFVIFLIHWINGLIVVAAAAILFILALLNEKMTKTQVEKSNEINIFSMKTIDKISRNAEVIKAMGMKKDLTNSWNKINDSLTNITTKIAVRSSIISNVTKSIRLLIQMLVMAVGAVLVIKGKMSSGGIIATSILSGKALAPFDQAVTIYKAVINAKKSYTRLVESLKKYEQKESKINLQKPEGKITLEKLVYTKGSLLIIKGINIAIAPGEIIGVIGPSASGKTTLARLMANVISPTKGSVRLDNADLKNQNSEELGKYIGYLPQDIELFDGSIKENIARMNQKAKPEDIIKAAQFTETHELILKLPKGYETKSDNLSAGQRQRIALARSFFGNPKFVILDEPNSNLDNEGDNALIKTIAKAKQNKITTVIISHRPSILNSVDKILVLHNGEAKIFDSAKKVIASLAEGK